VVPCLVFATPLRYKKKQLFTKCYTGPRVWTDFLERPRQRKVGLRCGTSLDRVASLKTAASEMTNHNLDLVGSAGS
jgi:hypothetical protein